MAASPEIPIETIERLLEFARKSDRGDPSRVMEWPNPDGRRACSLLVPDKPFKRWLITTKMDWIENVYLDDFPRSSTAILGMSTVPTRAQLKLMKHLVSSAPSPPLFVGDLDPHDLVVFLFIKLSDPKSDLRWLGIGDAWFDTMGTGWSSEEIKFTQIPMTRFEQKVLRRMISLGIDIGSIVGQSAFRILEEGKKIELEGASSQQILGSNVTKLRTLLS